MPGPVSAQWALNETSSSALSVAKGVFRAATSDNVQPLALLTVEAFGNTLAICQQTQLVLEKEASKRHVAYFVKFLQSQIGYAANDSATHLASSGAGVRFLGLAAALLCTASTFIAAQALELMIKATSRSDQILPTLGQLQDLLSALDHKLARIGFADNVLGWEAILVGYPSLPREISQALRLGYPSPSVEELRALVDAFRMLDRVGDTTSSTSVRITSAVTSPWVIAFTKWCLGDPPKIILEDGTVVMDQPNSRVTLIVQKGGSIAITVEIFDELDNLSQLWSESEPVPAHIKQLRWTGMVSIQSFGQRRLRYLQLSTGLGNRALLQALSYSFELVKSYLAPDAIEMLNDRQPHHIPGYPVNNPDLDPNLWPSDTKILEILKEYMSSLEHSAPEMSALRKDEKIVNLSTVRAHLDELQAQCSCGYSHCGGSLGSGHSCRTNDFKCSVTLVVCDILALSLYDTIYPVYVSLDVEPTLIYDVRPNGPFQEAIHAILFGKDSTRGISSPCTVSHIFGATLKLLGHKTYIDKIREVRTRSWIASAQRGQVVYPTIFDTSVLDKQPLLVLGGAPGMLEYKGSRYDRVFWKENMMRMKPRKWMDVAVRGPQNLIPEDRLEWLVKKGDKCLEVSCGPTGSAKAFNPMNVIDMAAQALYVRACPHKTDAILDPPADNAFFITPHYDHYSPATYDSRPPLSKTCVIAVSGNEGLRLFALSGSAGNEPGVVRMSACLQCCIAIARQYHLQYVVA
ncbi:MAG: hypothetical protein M1836_004173 [Candelina mexicana]|nr:MAG: hypothetical protein M1836_004173 [Candelina mexicana]